MLESLNAPEPVITDPLRADPRLADPSQAFEDERKAALAQIIRTTPRLMEALEVIRSLELPDAWIVSGALYQTVWNHLTERAFDHGIKDYDIVYYDGSDTSYDAEDRVIQSVNAAAPHLAAVLEIRNQARIHLWFETRFGTPYPELSCALESLSYYAARTHAVAARLTDSGLEIHAPFGLANVFALRLVPHYALNNRETYEAKAVRMKQLWPELTIIPWATA
ncbi:MAG: nucleotidyltransferase family protein [Rhodobacteraceae bacterium]|nr:nucleotidyltransferase family protein [Paracoccaceae bacterium]